MTFVSCMKALPNTNTLFTLLLASAELLKSTPKIITFLPSPPLACEKLSFESNPIPYPEYLNLPTSVFFVNLIAPNRQSYKAILEVLVSGVVSQTI